jgi:hypothetical protein
MFCTKKEVPDSKSSSVQLYVQMVLLPDLIGLIVFSVKRKIIKKTISSTKLNHKTEWKKYLMQPDIIQIMKRFCTNSFMIKHFIIMAAFVRGGYLHNFACTVFWQTVSGRIVVKSPDKDVLVLLVHYFPKMKNTSELWFQTGLNTSTKDCKHYIPVHELMQVIELRCVWDLASCSCSNWMWYHFFVLWYREEVYVESSERDTQSV